MKRITRTRKLTTAQAAKYDRVRQAIEKELPDLLNRHNQRMALREELQNLLDELKAERKKRKISLSNMVERTGMDRAALSRLEAGLRVNPTVDTLCRYADAVGKKLIFSVSK